MGITKKIPKYVLMFAVGAFFYMGLEVIFRQASYRLMGATGGIALITVDCINDKLSWDIPLVWQMIIGGIIITCLELIAGEFALNVLHTRMWDYSNQWMSMCNDLICPLFSCFWVLLSGVGIFLADAINYYVLREERRPYYRHLNGNIWFQMPERI